MLADAELDRNAPTSKRRRRGRGGASALIAGAMLGVLACLAPGAGLCAQLHWEDKPYPYVAVQQSVADALRALGRHMGVAMHIGETIDMTINGRVPTASAIEFLDFVCDTYGLVWYFDGAVLEVVQKSEMKSVVLMLQRIRPERLKEALVAMDIWDDRFFFTANQELRLAHLSGPPRYMEMVTQVAEKLEAAQPRSVRVLRGGAGMSMPAGQGVEAPGIGNAYSQQSLSDIQTLQTLQSLQSLQQMNAGSSSLPLLQGLDGF